LDVRRGEAEAGNSRSARGGQPGGSLKSSRKGEKFQRKGRARIYPQARDRPVGLVHIEN